MKMMDTLNEPMGLPRCTIIGNPLFSPDGYLLSAQKVRRKWSLKHDVHMKKNNFEIAQFGSAPKTSTLYSFFEENYSGRFSIIGRGYRDAALRVLPEGDSLEEEYDFIDGIGVIEKALNKGYLETIRYSSALMRVIDAVVDYSSEVTEEFDSMITQQIEEVGNKVDELGFSEREIIQVTELGDGKVIVFPKGFFDDDGTPRKKLFSGVSWGSTTPNGLVVPA